MPGYGQTQRTPAQKSDGGAAEHRTAARDHAGAADALGTALNESPRSRSLMQLRAALDESPRVRAQLALQHTLNDPAPVQKKPNATALPDRLRADVEQLSGLAMDDVRVHYNSAKPAAVQAHAYTQGTEIHVAPGQEQHLPPAVIQRMKRSQGDTDREAFEQFGASFLSGADIEDVSSDESFAMTKEDEVMAYLATEARYDAGLDKIRYDKRGEEQELRPDTWKGAQGRVGEFLARSTVAAGGGGSVDLNKVKHNYGGVDHLVNVTDKPEMMFEQSKMHIADSTATPESYQHHVKMAKRYAVKAVRDLKKNQKLLEAAMQKAGFDPPSQYTQLIAALKDVPSTADDDIEGSEAHEIVSSSMGFGVPSDIYDKIPEKDRGRFIRLEMSVADVKEIMNMMLEQGDIVPSKAGGSKAKKEDQEWTQDDM